MSDIKSNPKFKEFPSSKWDEDSKEIVQESVHEKCPICLSHIEDRSVTNTCLHEFCFQCLKEWAKVKTVCPLCKSSFQFIICNIRSDDDYDEFPVAADPQTNTRPLIDHRRREETSAAILACTDVAIIRKRRLCYRNGMMSYIRKGSKTIRDISSYFYLQNPAQRHRLVPWLRRELIVLFGAKNLMVVDRISNLFIAAISCVDLESDEFRDDVEILLHDRTDQFLHEYISFAKSPYDIKEYDQRTSYRSKKSQNSADETALSTPLITLDLSQVNHVANSSRSASFRDRRMKRKISTKNHTPKKKRDLAAASCLISSSSDSDAIEFVKLIKGPGLKTPDVVIDLISSSSDDSSSTPGPSTSSAATTSSSIHSHVLKLDWSSDSD